MNFIQGPIFEYLVLGAIQGITEWLPISSEGFLFLFKNWLSNGNFDSINFLKQVLLLHFGTLLAALVYFRKDVFTLINSCLRYTKLKKQERQIINFLFISTFITGVIGIIFLKLFFNSNSFLIFSGVGLTFFIGFLLLITGIMQINVKDVSLRSFEDLNLKDSILLGVGQGLSVFPGISRSGTTVSLFLLRKLNKSDALKLSFLMSIPVVFFGNILLNFSDLLIINLYSFFSIFSSFVFGILTIHYFIKISKKVNFGYFLIIFSILVLLSGILELVL